MLQRTGEAARRAARSGLARRICHGARKNAPFTLSGALWPTGTPCLRACGDGRASRRCRACTRGARGTRLRRAKSISCFRRRLTLLLLLPLAARTGRQRRISSSPADSNFCFYWVPACMQHPRPSPVHASPHAADRRAGRWSGRMRMRGGRPLCARRRRVVALNQRLRLGSEQPRVLPKLVLPLLPL